MMAKKKVEEDAWLWMSLPSVPGMAQVANHTSIKIPSYIPYTANPFMLRQVFNIPAYIIYGTLLPTPLEQIAFAKDPLGIVPPYEWRGGFHAILDLSATVGDPFGVARSQIQSPHEAAYGRPDPNYWKSEEGLAMNELFAASLS